MSRFKRYPGTIERRGSSYRVILYADGKRHTFTLKDVDRKGAEVFARSKSKRLQELAKREALGLPGAVAMSALFDQFEAEYIPALAAANTRRSYLGGLKVLRAFFVDALKDPQVDEVRRAHVKRFLSWRRLNAANGSVASNRTLQKDRALLSIVFGFAEDLELREGNPVARVKAPKVTARNPVILTPEQYEALLGECEANPVLWLYALALGETGGRCESEVLWLRWEDVDLEGGFLHIVSGRDGRRTKSAKDRWVPLTPRLGEALREHFANYRMALYGGKRSPWIFHHVRTRRRAVAGERVRSFRSSFDAAARRAKLPAEFHAHDLRHARVTTWLAAGANPVHVKEAVGHSSLATTMAYTHLAREHLRSLVEDAPSREQLRELGS